MRDTIIFGSIRENNISYHREPPSSGDSMGADLNEELFEDFSQFMITIRDRSIGRATFDRIIEKIPEDVLVKARSATKQENQEFFRTLQEKIPNIGTRSLARLELSSGKVSSGLQRRFENINVLGMSSSTSEDASTSTSASTSAGMSSSTSADASTSTSASTSADISAGIFDDRPIETSTDVDYKDHGKKRRKVTQ